MLNPIRTLHKFFSVASAITFLASTPICSADESITITTYYPAPYGVYTEMRAKKMVIGDVDMASTPSPSDGAVTFKPVSQPTAYSEGTLYYDQGVNTFKYNNGSAWQKLSGSLGENIPSSTSCTNPSGPLCSATLPPINVALHDNRIAIMYYAQLPLCAPGMQVERYYFGNNEWSSCRYWQNP